MTQDILFLKILLVSVVYLVEAVLIFLSPVDFAYIISLHLNQEKDVLAYCPWKSI